MNKFDRIYDLYRILKARRMPIARADLADRLECSEPTVKRLVQKLRDELGAPIETVRGRGYRMDAKGGEALFELPGLWFNASELHALLSAHHLLSQVEPGILSQEIEPLKRRIESILRNRRAGYPRINRRVRIITAGSRPVDRDRFRQLCNALARRRRMAIEYHARSTDEKTSRVVSPQRLTHYRDNWYVDAWCHWRKDLRRFAFERIGMIRVLDEPVREVGQQRLAEFSAAYGIFIGTGSKRAVLRFTADRARWLAEERWHPDQQTRWLEDGRFELSLPYDQPTELVMDILRYGPDVEVVRPAALRRAVRARLEGALAVYEK